MQSLMDKPYTLAGNDLIVGEKDTQYVLRVKDLPEDQKPREKLLQTGPKSLNMAELVAVLWGVGTKKEEVLSMSKRILKEYGEKSIQRETNPSNLAIVLDIPLTKACQIVACFELGRRFFEEKAGKPVFIRTASQAFDYLDGMASNKKEQLRGLYLNSRYQVIHDELISVGSLTANIVHPREVFQPAIEHGAVAVVVAHNHPSGNPEPTEADIEVTKQLAEAGRVLGIDLLDHLVLTDKKYKSLMEDLF